MTRFTKIEIDGPIFQAVAHVFVVLAAVALGSGAAPQLIYAAGGVALFGGFVLAEYETAVGFGAR